MFAAKEDLIWVIVMALYLLTNIGAHFLHWREINSLKFWTWKLLLRAASHIPPGVNNFLPGMKKSKTSFFFNSFNRFEILSRSWKSLYNQHFKVSGNPCDDYNVISIVWKKIPFTTFSLFLCTNRDWELQIDLWITV